MLEASSREYSCVKIIEIAAKRLKACAETNKRNTWISDIVLSPLKREIDSIKEQVLEITLTQDDIDSLREAEVDLKKGKTNRL